MIYFDNASTTQTSSAAANEALKMMRDNFANPSSLHSFGFSAEKVITEAKNIILKALGSSGELYFTSGGTEANNTIILGAAKAYKRRGNHFITTTVEHPSVTAAYKQLEQQGACVTCLPLNKNGEINLNDLKAAIREDTILVSLMAVNNEIGNINNLEEIYKTIKTANPNTLYHADCVQAFCKHPINAKFADYISISAHKIFGVKGCGAIVHKQGVRFSPIIFGGGQQQAVRPGTENTPAIAAFGRAAADLYPNIEKNLQKTALVKAELAKICTLLPDVHINGGSSTTPYILNLSFKGVRGEVLLHALEDKGIYVSTGSACSSKAKKNENVVAKVYGTAYGSSAVRFSFSSNNTTDEAVQVVTALTQLVPQLRRFQRH